MKKLCQNILHLNDVCMYVCMYSSTSSQAGCDRRSNFRLSTAGLTSEFSVYLRDYHSKAKDLSLPNHLRIAGGEEKDSYCPQG